MSERRKDAYAILGMWSVAVCWLLATVGDYGLTWDANTQREYGDLVTRYFATGFRDKSCNHFLNLRYYGGLFEVLANGFSAVLGMDIYAGRHLFTGLVSTTAVPAVMLGVRALGGGRAGMVIGALALLLFPRWLGHTCNNSKDAPFAVGFTWSMVLLMALWDAPRVRWRAVLLASTAVGLTMAVRAGGVILLGFAGAGMVLHVVQFRRRFRVILRSAPRRLLLLLQGTAFLALAWLLMIAIWPWAHESPLLHPTQAVAEATNFSMPKQVLFAGEALKSNALPRKYLWHYIWLTTPLLLLALSAAGATYLASQLVRNQHRVSRVLFVLWLAFPLVYFPVMLPAVYDGLRHFLFLLPCLAICCGLAIEHLRSQRARKLALAGLVLLALPSGYDVLRWHPYQTSYFQPLIRGPLHTQYDIDYWATAYKECAQEINRLAAGQPVSVLLAANRHAAVCFQHYADENIAVQTHFSLSGSDLPEAFQYTVAMTRYGLHTCFQQAPVVYEVRRRGCLLAVIRAQPGLPE